MPRFTWAEVCARRLERHFLSGPSHDARPADIVRAMCGAHAQVMSAAELSIGLRTAGLTRADVRKALWTERSLIKTYGPRGTIHLLPSQDLPMWAGALSATPYGQQADPRNELLTHEQAEAVIQAIALVLEDAELTADELTKALIDHLGPWAGDPVMAAFQGMWPRWRMAQSTAGVRGAFCFGPDRGRNVTYTSPRRWLPGFQPAGQQPALASLVMFYLHAYGPATPQQFAQWLAVPRGWATDLFDSLSSQIQPVEVDGVLAWVVAGDTGVSPGPPQGVRLLPYFDGYVVGSHPRELLFPGRAALRALPGGHAGTFPVLLVDGMVVGVWHQRRSGKVIDFTVEPFGELTAARRGEIDAQVQRVAEILEGRPRLSFGPVTVGSHA
jgi:hypothetical protein